MLLFQLAVALAVPAVCAFAPGFYFVRRFAWGGVEKLCGSIALSLILLWLVAWSVYVVAPDWQGVAYPAVTLACVALAVAARKDAAALLRMARVRRVLAGFAFLLLWTLVVLSVIRVYSGAGWGGDWLEHFQRSLFFLHHFPANNSIFVNVQLPARPPAMNVLAAFVLAQTGDRFEVFQAAFAFLNLLVFFPCCLALPVLARPRRPGILPLVGIFATSPVVMQNATYTWTKSLPAFFVILAILLYLEARRNQDRTRMVFAFVVLAMGMLVHYSAGPYIAFLALHYLVVAFRGRPARWKELGMVAGLCGALLATWFAWSLSVYGVHTTLASNTSVETSRQYQGHNLEKIAGNLLDSVVPPLVRDPKLVRAFDQPNRMAQVRDHVFIVYQLNLIFSMGALGGVTVLWLVITTLRRPVPERFFWIGLILWAVVVGIAVVGERDILGVAHLTLLPMEVLGLTLLAARFGSRRWLSWLIVVGCAIDFSLGVWLHARVQHLENTPQRPVYLGLGFIQGRFRPGLVTEDSLSNIAWQNWMRKHQYKLAEEWRRDVDAFRPGDPAVVAARAEAIKGLDALQREDETLWHGWYQRHGGEVEMIGDHFGAGDETSAVLLVLAAGILWKMARARQS